MAIKLAPSILGLTLLLTAVSFVPHQPSIGVDCEKEKHVQAWELASLGVEKCNVVNWMISFEDGSLMGIPDRGIVLTKSDLLDETATAIEREYAEISVYRSKRGHVAIAVGHKLAYATHPDAAHDLQRHLTGN